MSYKASIRHNATGEVREYVCNWDWFKNDPESGDYFWWTEGNSSCDCNRFLYFERAIGNDPDLDDATCSDGKYSVLYVELPDGRRIQIDRVADQV